MKSTKSKSTFPLISLLCIMLLIIIACEPNVVFEKAMPPDIEAISSVPEQFQGVYLCESDSSRLYADRFLIWKETYFRFVTTIQEVMDSEDCSIVAGGLYLPGKQECIPFEYISEDTITAKVYDIDTLFAFTEREVLKLYKGRLFLNIQNDREHFTTFMITPQENGDMLWELIDVPDKLDKIKEISLNFAERQTKKDKVQYILNPTLVEFERILNKNYTMECDVLVPINLEKG